MLQVIDILIQRRDFFALEPLYENVKEIKDYIDMPDKIEYLSKRNKKIKTFYQCYSTFIRGQFSKRRNIFEVVFFIKNPETMMCYLIAFNKKHGYNFDELTNNQIVELLEYCYQFIDYPHFGSVYRKIIESLEGISGTEILEQEIPIIEYFLSKDRVDILQSLFGIRYQNTMAHFLTTCDIGIARKLVPIVNKGCLNGPYKENIHLKFLLSELSKEGIYPLSLNP